MRKVGAPTLVAGERSGALSAGRWDEGPVSFGANSGTLWGWREAADGGTQFSGAKLLLLDDAFARGLAKTPDPAATWEALLAAGEAAPKEMNLLVEEWFGAEDWWMRNEKRVKQLGRGQAP